MWRVAVVEGAASGTKTRRCRWGRGTVPVRALECCAFARVLRAKGDDTAVAIETLKIYLQKEDREFDFYRDGDLTGDRD